MAPRAISRSLAKLTRPALEKRGRDFAALVAGWAEIAGPRLAGDTALDRLARPRDGGPGVLHLRVTPGLAVEIQHTAPQLIERINAFLGHAAVARIAMVQRPVAGLRRAAPAVARVPRPAGRAAAAAAVCGIEDEGLRAALARLGAHLLDRG
ncbi:MAG: DUF721 domain-containing protein [Rhodospirillales bacterium]|jgi:hypothetical protein